MDEKLKEAIDIIKWFIDNDDTNEGDIPMAEYHGKTWNEINAYWIDGLDSARRFVEQHEKVNN